MSTNVHSCKMETACIYFFFIHFIPRSLSFIHSLLHLAPFLTSFLRSLHDTASSPSASPQSYLSLAQDLATKTPTHANAAIKTQAPNRRPGPDQAQSPLLAEHITPLALSLSGHE